jgi:uncharacterized protein with PIN domain
VRLYLDHAVDVAFAARLRHLGHDVLTTREVGHTEALDEQQLVFATHEGRVFLTHNRRDFRRLHRQWTEEGRRHTPVIATHAERPTPGIRPCTETQSINQCRVGL